MSKLIYLLSFVLFASFGNAQDSLKDKLYFYGDVMLNALDDDNRVLAGENFNTLFADYIKENPTDSLTWLKWISIQSPEDKSFRILTWELKRNDDSYSYFGYLQKPDGTGYTLHEEKSDFQDVEFDTRTKDDWLGAIYYGIKNIGENTYALFGVNHYSKFENVKIAEVLSFEDDEPIFGKEVFKKAADIKTRLILRFADDASVSLTFSNSLNLIIFDHLIPRMGRMEGQGSTFLPDGSYEGYVPADGIWEYKEKLYDHVFEEAPRPKPVLNQKKNGLFKNKKKQ